MAQAGATPQEDAETTELLIALRDAVRTTQLSPHQREVLVALRLNDVPIDVLAKRLDTTRGALYKTVHDARHKLRRALATRGLGAGANTEATSRPNPHSSSDSSARPVRS
jgi:RNA polymerase sigma-70 factor, ECF subfamily